MPDGSFRLYNRRDGHSLPSNRVRFFGNESESKVILSSGCDGTFRRFHLYNQSYNRHIGRSRNLAFTAKKGANEIFVGHLGPLLSAKTPMLDFSSRKK